MAAWLWLTTWGLWWLLVIMGSQGTTPVMSVIGFLALPMLIRVRPKISLDVLAFFAFMVWCAITTLWSDGAKSGLMIFDFEKENIAIESPAVRLMTTAIFCFFAFWAAEHFKPKVYNWGLWASRIGMGIIFAFFFVAAINFNVVTSLGEALSNSREMYQNITRAANLMALSLPVFLAILNLRRPAVFIPAMLVSIAVVSILAARSGADAALLSILFASVVGLATYFIGRNSFRILAVLSAVLIMTMPLIVGGIVLTTRNMESGKIPLSFQSRLDTFEYVSEKTNQKWLTGWGIDASRSWDEKKEVEAFGQTVQYRIVPGHPHNMPLQVWAEAGLIGALLCTIAILLLGNRLYRMTANDEDRLLLALQAALWGGAMIFALVSYKVWNDAFWTAILFMCTGFTIVSKVRANHG